MDDRTRVRQETLLIYGKNSVLAALSSGHPVIRITFESGSDKDDRIRVIKGIAARRNVPMEYKLGSWFQKSFRGEPHQGVAALCAPVEANDIGSLLAKMPRDPQRRALILVDQVTDPHNLGAIIRVAAASGAGGVVITKDRTSPINAPAVAASAGTVFNTSIAAVANLAYAMGRLKKEGYWLYGLEARGGGDYRSERYSHPAAFVIGSEGEGMRDLTKRNVDIFITIPMRSDVESLNVSTALAVVLFHALRA